jgi:shikimate kinase
MEMVKKNIVLTGFMGTGKTAVGRRLAEKLDYGFVDTDALIEARDGRTIPEIFAESGEPAFRAMERITALELAEMEGLVISTGGGLMLDEFNAAALSEKGRVFCLTAEPKAILARLVVKGVEGRPLLEGDDPLGKIEALLAVRQERYEAFEMVATDRLAVEEVVAILLGKILMLP